MLQWIEEELKTRNYNRQVVWEDKIPITNILQKIEDWTYKSRKTKLDLNIYNLGSYNFECPNLFEFIVHYKLTQNSNLKYPVIINKIWQVIDGRHRVCKAIIEWKKEIDAIQLLDDDID